MLLKGSKTEKNLKEAFEEEAQANRRILKSSTSDVLDDYADMYLGMEKTAREEGFDEIAEWFANLDEGKTKNGKPKQSLESVNFDLMDQELRRAFEICSGCRKCFDKCETFPKLFELIDDNKASDITGIESSEFKPVVNSCTLCDNCFTSCPYVAPHETDLDFPRIILKYRAMERSRL